tara:strand:+ start:446 stop:808 length:363 start_codon:yes stop_codon:yes gene_type:complete
MGFSVKQNEDGTKYKLNDGKWTDFPSDVQSMKSGDRVTWVREEYLDSLEEQEEQKQIVEVETAKKVAESAERRTSHTKRARTKKGHYKADDPSTPDVNEAWVGGKAPRKKIARTKNTAKK